MVFCVFFVGTGGSYDFTPPPDHLASKAVGELLAPAVGALAVWLLVASPTSVHPLPGPGTRGATFTPLSLFRNPRVGWWLGLGMTYGTQVLVAIIISHDVRIPINQSVKIGMSLRF